MTMLTTAKAAERLDVGERHVRYLCGEGIIEAERFGTQWMIPADEVDRYNRERRPPGPRPKAEAEEVAT